MSEETVAQDGVVEGATESGEGPGGSTPESAGRASRLTDGAFEKDDTAEGDTAADQEQDQQGSEDRADGDAEQDVVLTGAPEGDYADLTLNEGITITDEDLPLFHEMGKKLNLSQDGLSEAANQIGAWFDAKANAMAEQGRQAFVDLQKTWENEIETDQELGGDHLKESDAHVRAFIVKFGGRDLVKALDDTGMGSHPVLWRAMVAAGKALAEDSFHGDVRGEGGEADISVAEQLYDRETGLGKKTA